MRKPLKHTSFNRKAVGEITRGGGFSSLVKEVESGSITVLYKFNEPVAIILPCDRIMETAYQMSAGTGAFIADAENNDTPEGLKIAFIRSLIESAAFAKLIIGIDSANAIEQEVLKAGSEWLKKNSAQDTALSRNDNRSGAVSQVKLEEPLDDGSSLSRKRGRPKKQTSSAPKR
jgi:antitoxin (DNA-binding transcriptional repressor) of toxin-antitoxin stability system